MSKLSGKCLCGSTVYRCDAEPMRTVICHCRHCQKHTGSSFGILVVVPRGSLVFQGDMLKTFTDAGDSGKPVLRQFCGGCGSPLSALPEKVPDLAFVYAGTLDDTCWVSPTTEIFREHAQSWIRANATSSRTLIDRTPPAPIDKD